LLVVLSLNSITIKTFHFHLYLKGCLLDEVSITIISAADGLLVREGIIRPEVNVIIIKNKVLLFQG